jgi:uncharacterized protein
MVDKSFRMTFPQCQQLFVERLSEPSPGRIQLLAGPRQVGKTTLLLEIAERHGEQALYGAMDGPEASLPGFWDRLWARAEEVATRTGQAVVLLDEVHQMPQWSARLKAEWDRLRRLHIPVHVVATGSSALHLGEGSHESLAGRFERTTLVHWPASVVANAFALSNDDAATLIVRMGAYPGAVPLRNDVARWTAYVRDAIVAPAIGRDILSLTSIRRPALLRQLFALCVGAPASIIALQKLQGQLQDAGALETIAHYLRVLEDAFLIAALEKHAAHTTRRRAAPPKLIALSNAFLGASDSRGIPEQSLEPERFGAWVENACLAYAWNAGQHVTYWREEPFEVDAILEGSWGRWAIEVKTGVWTARDLGGLLEFTRRHREYRPLVVCDAAAMTGAKRAGVDAIRWQDFLVRGVESLK